MQTLSFSTAFIQDLPRAGRLLYLTLTYDRCYVSHFIISSLRIMSVSWSPLKNQDGSPPKFGSDVEADDATHTPGGYVRVYYLCNWGLWESRAGISSRSEMAWERAKKRDCSGFLLWVRTQPGWEFPPGQGLAWFQWPTGAKGENSKLPYTDVGARGRERAEAQNLSAVRLQKMESASSLQTIFYNSLELPFCLPPC